MSSRGEKESTGTNHFFSDLVLDVTQKKPFRVQLLECFLNFGAHIETVRLLIVFENKALCVPETVPT